MVWKPFFCVFVVKTFKLTVHYLQKCVVVYNFTLSTQGNRFEPSKDFFKQEDIKDSGKS